MSTNLSTGGPSTQAEDVTRLRRMKLTAAAFLAVAAGAYAATYLGSGGGSGWVGFVRAGAEAAMVGGLADWFAVTALFRRPLHLPIPHTAIIPEKKDEIATKLGTFVQSNFLTPELMATQLRDAKVVARLGARLREPATADRLAAEVAHAVAVALEEADTDWLVGFAFGVAQRDLSRRSYSPILGQMLARALETDVPTPLLEVLSDVVATYLRENRVAVRTELKSYLDRRHAVVAFFVNDKRADALIDLALREVEGIGRDPEHPFRAWLDAMLGSLAGKLETDPGTREKVDLVVHHLLEDDRYQEMLRAFARGFADSLRLSLNEGDGGLAVQVSQVIRNVGARLVDDTELNATLEGWLERAVNHAIREYGDEFTVLVERTVAGWDAQSASRRIEVAVGRDLQFIRINGTVVGALAGLAIHAVTLAV